MITKTGLSPHGLRRLYCDLKKTDLEIAEFFNVDRTAIVHMRKRHNIESREIIGEIGEQAVIEELVKRGYKVENMNLADKLHPFDICIENRIRVEVKTSNINDKNIFTFALSERASNNNVESNVRLKLPNGRTRKIFRKTCDLMIFVGVDYEKKNHFFILKPEDIADNIQTVSAPLSYFSNAYMNKHRDRWNLIDCLLKEKPDAPTSDH